MTALLQLDTSLVLYFHSLASMGQGSILVTRLLGTYFIFIPILLGVVGLFYTLPVLKISGPFLFLQMLLVGVISWVVNNVISVFWFRNRPYVQHPDSIQPIIDIQLILKSFPSDHAALAMALATIVTLYVPRVGILFIIIALLIGFSRIAAGVHFPTDILAGFIIGAVIALFVHKIFI